MKAVCIGKSILGYLDGYSEDNELDNDALEELGYMLHCIVDMACSEWAHEHGLEYEGGEYQYGEN